MYYLLRAQPDPKLKEKESKLPKAGKIFLILFFLFHVAFLGFNFWYFYANVASDVDTIVDDGVDTVDASPQEAIE